MFRRKDLSAKAARRYAEGLVALWAGGDVAGAMTLLAHQDQSEETKRRAAAGLIWATSLAPKTIEILQVQVEGSAGDMPELRRALQIMSMPTDPWSAPPSGVPLEMLIYWISGTIARDRDGLQVLWDLGDEKYRWPDA